MKKLLYHQAWFLIITFVFLSCISFFSSAQSGITWTTGLNIAASSYGNMHPRITTDASGNPVVIWGRMSDQSVFISRWNGTAFTVPVKVNPVTMTIATMSWQGPHIASKGDTIYIVMKETPEAFDTSHIYIMRSTDGGINFSAPVQVDNIADSISRFPTVTTDDLGNPVVGFMKFDAGFGNARWVVTKSNDFGNTFSTDLLASGWSGGTVCDCCPGAVISSGNFAAMLYRDNLANIRDMWAGISVDNCNSFSQGIPVDQGNWMIMSCPASGPDAVVYNDTMYTAYMSGATGTSLVYLSKTSVSSLNASSGSPLTGTFAGLTMQNYPRIANDENAMAVAWKQIVNGADQLALRFTNNIANGFPLLYDTVDLNHITNTDVVIRNGNIFIVWEDDNSGTVKFRRGSFSSVGIEESNQQNLISVYPNPAVDFVNINFNSIEKSEKIIISVSDIFGRQVFYNQIIPFKNNFSIDASEFNNGIYLINIKSGQLNSTQKLLINHQ